MATVSKLIIKDVVRNEFFTDTVTVTSTGVLNSIVCVPNFEDPSISVNVNSNSVTISGTNLTVKYIDEIKYVESGSSGPAGESDGEQDSSVVIGIFNIPPNKDMFEFNQDLRDDVIRTYTLTVSETVGPVGFGFPLVTVFTLTQTIQNDWYFGKIFIENYLGIKNAA